MIYKGIFWLIEGELYTKKLECDKLGNVIGDGSGLNSKSGDNFNHRLTWEDTFEATAKQFKKRQGVIKAICLHVISVYH